MTACITILAQELPEAGGEHRLVLGLRADAPQVR